MASSKTMVLCTEREDDSQCLEVMWWLCPTLAWQCCCWGVPTLAFLLIQGPLSVV